MSSQRNIYLQMTSLEQARAIVREAFDLNSRLVSETVAATEAVGRILSEPVVARLSSPNFHAAAMDGIALAAKSSYGAHDANPKKLRLGKDAFYVNTGHVLPPGTDAVIMIEHVQVVDDLHVQIEAPAFPWQHVRKMGEDIVATEMLFARKHRLTAYCIGALLSAGVFEVPVLKTPKVLLVPTGSELVDWHTLSERDLQPGQVIDANSYVLSRLVEDAGGQAVRHAIMGDDIDAIKQAVGEAMQKDFDVALILGGSSAGSEDFARHVISELGEVLVHGVTMMPGKPVIAGRAGDKPVFGIPGYPVSAILAFEQLVQPLLLSMLGEPEMQRPQAEVATTRKIASKLGVEEFVRVKIGQVGERLVATPLPRGAGSITSITEADGIIRIPAHIEGLPENTPHPAELLRPLRHIARTLVIVGSHDNTLDVLADELRAQGTRLSLSSSHVGSMGGVMAVRRNVCHMAGTHLLDTDDGSYNLSYIRKYLADIPVRLIHLVMRDQGLMVPPGNPKQIRGIEDLVRDNVRLINRQKGSGTRILLDHHLNQLGIETAAIAGYADEEYTHMAVAAAVLSGAADTGLGILAAARALGLDFIPVVTEQYDLVIPGAYFESEAVQTLLQVIKSDDFKQRINALGGYHTRRTGEILL